MTDDVQHSEQKYIRITTKHKDDWYPVIVWFVVAHFTGMVLGKLSSIYFMRQGMTEMVPVELVGGGSSSTIFWTQAEWYSVQIQVVAFILVFCAFFIRNWRYGNG